MLTVFTSQTQSANTEGITITGGLKEGKTVIIIGRISSNANTNITVTDEAPVPPPPHHQRELSPESNINLKDGSHPAARTALCISPHFENDHPHIVYKTFQNDSWDSDQPTSKSPLLQGQLFTIKILVTTQAYKISANGEDLMVYNHRIPFTQMNTILVEGMELDFIGHLNLVVASYKKEVVDGLKPGKIIVIYGIANADCKRMEINLRHRYGIAFHYLCRFEENAVVRNTWQNGGWGTEEKSQDIPFKNGEFFEIKITCKAEQYDVSVNGQQAHTYKHCFTKLEDIDVIEVCGGLQLFSVEAKDP
ncbi:32 kDa beta-galactoside-binding lectin-like [Sinocyclocheilus rhinocerous]|uniref:32 kDa beta-galactoside-binding lectin-like n=1 Tax=Sinocyclocheilus rhinocerous TaxID=307959 RepID=UPI0007B82591|nr:PREDICTED: 32 kDa beta-galactoside-binding lectin-like [Sinocyclocheilus rhinocerous]